ncbi:MAG: hypothetical protein Q8L02_02210 [Candidatus Nitrotoga sp.]|nr:hypothetical protein [Candidatus Nitrotoga sp.]
MKLEHRYLKWVAGGTVGLMALVALLNWLVNPFSIFDTPAIPRFNSNKPVYVDHLRLTHVYKVERLQPECILLGTSRTGRGLAPDHPVLANLKCYNLALPAISMYEMRRYLQHAQAVRPQKLVLLSMDFRVFSTVPDLSGAFSEERLMVNSKGEKQFNLFSSRLPDLASSLISLPALLASLTTIRKQAWVKDTLAADGYWKPLTDRFDHLTAFRAYTQNSAQRFNELRQNENIFRKNTEELRLLLREAYGIGTDVKLLIPPSHAWHWQTLWLSGLWPRFEELKHQLVSINEEEALRAGRETFPVWDFSGAYGPALEKLPATKTETMRWFWEPVHYKRALGDVVLSSVMGVAEHDAPEFAGYGVILDGAGLERHLGRLRTLQQAYAASHPDDVARIKALMDQADKHAPK